MFRPQFKAYLSGVALGLTLMLPKARGEDTAALTARINTADAASSLEATGLKPWHLKIAIQTYDAKGKTVDHGILEEWWGGTGTERREYRTAAYNGTEILKGGKLYRTKGAGSPPYYLAQLLRQAVHPMPTAREMGTAIPVLRKVKFGKVKLDCIMLTQPVKGMSEEPTGLFSTYCFDPGKDTLRATLESGQEAISRNEITAFEGKEVARDVSVYSDGVQMATSEVVKMEEAMAPENAFTPEAETVVLPGAVVPSGTMAGALISMQRPPYPPEAKKNKETGTVVLHAVIGTDGHIHALRVISAPSADFALSAIDAVRRWVYRPYLLNGVPTEVDTTITVNFKMKP